jgi:hypothetical protein
VISTATEVAAFRAAYTIARHAGYVGTKREFADLVVKAEHLFTDPLVGAAICWLEYMDKSERSARLHHRSPHVPHDGARFRPGRRRKVVEP